jgi:hypothetical protein
MRKLSLLPYLSAKAGQTMTQKTVFAAWMPMELVRNIGRRNQADANLRACVDDYQGEAATLQVVRPFFVVVEL